MEYCSTGQLYYRQNKEKIKLAVIDWQQRNKEKRKEYNSNYYLKNKEKWSDLRTDPRYYEHLEDEEEKEKYKRFNFHRYITDQEYDDNLKDLRIEYTKNKHGFDSIIGYY